MNTNLQSRSNESLARSVQGLQLPSSGIKLLQDGPIA